VTAPPVNLKLEESTLMRIHADFSLPAIVTPDQHQWVPSPQSGVERVMLDRVGEEKARATSMVRYAPDSHFPRHVHPGGEEILVLSGTFSDEYGDYPAGWYLRNPPGSSHQPFSKPGATIFVKLWQMQPGDTQTVRTDTHEPAFWERQQSRDVRLLFSSATEQVCLQRLAPGDAVLITSAKSAELLILDGSLEMGDKACELGSWIRLPVGELPQIVARERGAIVYLKTGHLPAMSPKTV
jgi:anti-sigma factor ChrR (cupin superfamily)